MMTKSSAQYPALHKAGHGWQKVNLSYIVSLKSVGDTGDYLLSIKKKKKDKLSFFHFAFPIYTSRFEECAT